MHVFQSMTIFVERLKDFENVTLFYMYKPEEILKTAELDLNHLLIFALVLLVGLFASAVIFQKKDIA